MKTQVNKHRKDVFYEIGDQVWLSSENIKITRPSKSLEDRQLGFYEVIEKVGAFYRLRIPPNWRKGDIFHPKLLRPLAKDPLLDQAQEAPRPIEFDDGSEYPVDDILDSRRYYGRLQYKIKWQGIDRDDIWYYADAGEFDNAKDVVDEFHRRYPKAPR